MRCMKEALVPSAHAAAPQLTWTVAEASCWSDPINSSAVGLDLKKGAGNQGRWWVSLSLRPSLSTLSLSLSPSSFSLLETRDHRPVGPSFSLPSLVAVT
ncbi:uncharacterized protein BO88DRAFT_36 [Aspergillus vadensis CBS 113365]|uniref:Uncharacterized protein n=1 Tax=Aspergillus vadensis (strain CBS 113365 / IMI 142717 / IBT 24658) TaxID=1448311 RepID=A0A319BQU8_ASPVC|nr:hypothetical protein BO88DRAFT_36 [Aspergillus vadensis CBS 113365]PYH74039.1 hypothetical protein BO88DRAFT_36 [Aspergillus vadensis CBS 113365]